MSMTRQEQLDAVVRNYGEWPNHPHSELAVWGDEESEVYFFARSSVTMLDKPAFTRTEVEQRKAELQNKPSLDGAPDWALSLAQDSEGTWHWWNAGPQFMRAGNSGKDFWLYLPFGVPVRFAKASKGEVIGDWRKTLEKCPQFEMV